MRMHSLGIQPTTLGQCSSSDGTHNAQHLLDIYCICGMFRTRVRVRRRVVGDGAGLEGGHWHAL